jgi:ABC-type ATPase with predicted acetyltransferase domain
MWDIADFANNYIHENPSKVNYMPNPVRIQVRIDPPHPLMCRKRGLNGAVLQMRREKPRSYVTVGVA